MKSKSMLKKVKDLWQNLFINKKGVELLRQEAQSFEKAGDYEGACYAYACAIDQGAREPEYREKIIQYYEQHGPFTFEKQLERMKKEYCACAESCGEGYHVGIMAIIKKILNKS